MVMTAREEVTSGTLSPGRSTHSQYLYWFLPSPESAGSDKNDLVDGDDDADDDNADTKKKSLKRRKAKEMLKTKEKKRKSAKRRARVRVCPLDNIGRD